MSKTMEELKAEQAELEIKLIAIKDTIEFIINKSYTKLDRIFVFENLSSRHLNNTNKVRK